MNKVLLAIATFVATIFLANSSFASFDANCFRVNITNNTNYTCTRTSTWLRNGAWYYNPPETIKAGMRSDWGACQTGFYGPDMALTFKCGDYFFSVRNRQNYTASEGGDQYDTTYNVNPLLNVTNKQTQHDSIRGDKPGIAQVLVSINASHFEFEQNGKPVTVLNLKPNSTGIVSIKNTGVIADITDVKVTNLAQPGFTNINCPTDGKGILQVGGSCSFNYQISQTPIKNDFIIAATGKGPNTIITNLPVTVWVQGHFEFEQNKKPISKLYLMPNDTGIITLKNISPFDITDAKVTNLNQPGFTNKNCPTDGKGILKAGSGCTFSYQIPATTKMHTITIAATGKDADNTPHNLSMNVNYDCVDEATIMDQEIKNQGFIKASGQEKWAVVYITSFWSVASVDSTTCRAYALVKDYPTDTPDLHYQGTLTWKKHLPLTASNRKFMPF